MAGGELVRGDIDPQESVTVTLTMQEVDLVMKGRQWELGNVVPFVSSPCMYLFDRISKVVNEKFGEGWQEEGAGKQ